MDHLHHRLDLILPLLILVHLKVPVMVTLVSLILTHNIGMRTSVTTFPQIVHTIIHWRDLDGEHLPILIMEVLLVLEEVTV